MQSFRIVNNLRAGVRGDLFREWRGGFPSKALSGQVAGRRDNSSLAETTHDRLARVKARGREPDHELQKHMVWAALACTAFYDVHARSCICFLNRGLAIKNSFDEAKEKARERQRKTGAMGMSAAAATSSLDALLGGGAHKPASKHANKMAASSPLKKGSAKVSGMPAPRIVNRSDASNWNNFISSAAPNSAAFVPASGASVSLPPIVEEKRCALLSLLIDCNVCVC